MTVRGKTIMCGVLFLDIAEYSKKSVSGQISLKERFNAYLSVAIRDVPIDDRIILDTGDGAALSFLGDIGDALQVARSMRESLREGLHMEPPLLVRMGINLGPVRLVRDLNGQPNIVGDGINVAQRVMGFADPGQILVSRSYYDAVSRLSPEYSSMFHYQGSRTDKHVREHEIYAIGYPGEFTGTLTLSGEASKGKGDLSGLPVRFGKSWKNMIAAFREATPPMRMVYAGAVLVPVISLVALGAVLMRSVSSPAPAEAPVSQVAAVIPASAVVPSPAAAVSASKPEVESHAEAKENIKEEARETAEQQAEEKVEDEEKHNKAGKAHPKKKTEEKTPVDKTSERTGAQTAFSVACKAGTSVFIDGQPKGNVDKSPLLIRVSPGSHLIMLLPPSKSQVFSKQLDVHAGKTIRLSPDLCH
jgi:hypothetical protein